MTESTNTATTASSKAAKAAVEVLPVVETVEVALEVPAKAVLNQKAVVAITLVVGAAAGAGVLWGVNKWRSRKSDSDRVEVPNDLSELEDEARKA